MFFLDKLLTRRIDTEINWLRALREESESWFNQLTNPILPVLLQQVDESRLDVQEKYRAIADKLLKEAFIINSGNKINNIFQEMGSRGLPFITSRDTLSLLLKEYLDAGLFLKRLSYDFNGKNARVQWREFKRCKDNLILEINNQLRAIG